MKDKIIGSKPHLHIRDGIKDGIPIAIGYFPIAMAFGILAKGVGTTLLETLGFSFIVFAGASQFVAVSMIALGASGIEIILTTLFLNFRHFIMSASLVSKIHLHRPILKPIISFFVTDESFSVASFAEGELTESYMLPMQLIPYFGWGIGTGVGYILGSILPPLLQQSMGIGLYAMFVALLVPEMKKSMRAFVLSILAGGINAFLIHVIGLGQGWSVVAAIIIVAIIGVLAFTDDQELGEGVAEYD